MLLTSNGDHDFIVWAYGDATDLLVNTFGNYSGTVLVSADASLYEIMSDGSWTIQIDR